MTRPSVSYPCTRVEFSFRFEPSWDHTLLRPALTPSPLPCRICSSLSTSQTAEEQMRIVQAERRKLEKTMAADKLKRIQYEEMAAENAHIKTALEKEKVNTNGRVF